MPHSSPRLILGCPLWAEPAWRGALYTHDTDADQRLYEYSRVFAAVEGNTTFYALPSIDGARRWASLLPADFHFCAKLPREVSHGDRLDPEHPDLQRFFQCMAPLEQRLGPVWLQLPARFGPQQLAQLGLFLDALPSDYRYAVEVRHLDFFRKDDNERRLNRLLHERGIERVMFDSRGLFASSARDPATLDAQRRKPRLPVHAVALEQYPTVRFIAGLDNEQSLRWAEPWLGKCAQWLGEGRSPMLFVHTPDNRLAPELARLFHARLQQLVPDLPPMPAWPGEQQQQESPQQGGLF
ncbi:DUF72 domain-containing protein [Pseudomonas sp. MYb185]|uniref:DUF72 domain-containing protein n=1 Tax=Pseudomonas sp. MYb185 TaxID=1848729 RepID=UPI000CFBBCFF|nr:DUF72 domain-containing protein [Pseudomonas sp. MYb185]PRB75713.1 hypothetical protein CQ007_17665 [Pseudomonas sp. MYb185]